MPTIELNIPPVTPQYREHLMRQGKSSEFIEAAWKYGHSCDMRRSEQAAQAILDYCHDQGYVMPLTFEQWHDGNIVARNEIGLRFLVIGSWTGSRYILRGILKKRRGSKSFKYSFNGQAGTGAIQVVHIAEQDAAHFPQFEEISKEYDQLLHTC